MKGALVARLQYLLPKNLISAAVHGIARSRRRWLRRALVHWFARQFEVDMSEARVEALDDYETFNAFFTRALKDGARPIDPDEQAVVSPCDGVLTEFGRLSEGSLVQAKGLSYGLDELLGEPTIPAGFENGHYATIYLAPHDYHRVHMPFTGRLVGTRYIPGARFSVNRATAGVIARLFSRNERVVTRFETRFGPAWIVLVGALNVSSIGTVALGEIASGRAREWSHSPGLELAKGAELGRFNLGSTVILAVPAGAIEFEPGLADGTKLAMGRRIGRLESG